MHKLLGTALIIGGLLVGGIVIWLMWLYADEGLLAGGTAVIGALLGLLLLAAPQLVLGVYMLYIERDGEIKRWRD
ncbi:MAG TPA: hypothetical protein PLD25_12025 [Chloroflexota bacterium]|nr:hypothetical protein [Chloroflexota bacterium]HUM68789.1 hypothetical protein [Chloroflexota bacterium]